MSMTRKDYVAIADALKAVRVQCIADYVNGAYVCNRNAGAIAFVLARDNSKFDRERFLKACGVAT